jgi:hypothetical protein
LGFLEKKPSRAQLRAKHGKREVDGPALFATNLQALDRTAAIVDVGRRDLQPRSRRTDPSTRLPLPRS